MHGHLIKGTDQLRHFRWADADLECVKIDYDKIELIIQESSGRLLSFSCLGYVGYEAVGFWDETIIGDVIVSEQGKFLSECTESIGKRLGEKPHETGCSHRNKRHFNVVSIIFIDGHKLNIAAAEIIISEIK